MKLKNIIILNTKGIFITLGVVQISTQKSNKEYQKIN